MNSRLKMAPIKIVSKYVSGEFSKIHSELVHQNQLNKKHVECIAQYNLLQDISGENITNSIQSSFILKANKKE